MFDWVAAAAGVVLSRQQQQWLSSSAWVAAAAGVVLSWQQQQWLSSSAWVVKCYFYVRGQEEQLKNEEMRRTTLRGCSVLEAKCNFCWDFISICPVLVKKQMLFWIMVIICLYIYCKLLMSYYNMLSTFNKNASHCKEIEIYWSEILF